MKTSYIKIHDGHFMSIVDVSPIDPGKLYYINRIFVHQRYRNSGVGSELMRQVCKDADKEQVILQVHPTENYGSDLKRLIKFFENFGFRKSKFGFSKDSYVRLPAKLGAALPDSLPARDSTPDASRAATRGSI